MNMRRRLSAAAQEEETTMAQRIQTDAAPQPIGPYSQALVAGPFVFVSGQGPLDPATGAQPDGVEAQTHQVMKNLRTILEAAGASMSDVVKSTVHLANLDDFATFNGVYAQYFTEPYPTRTTVGSSLLGILVEIDVIAYRGE
jgi:2-iminobutanoate/2-iminopropanoate deaminase